MNLDAILDRANRAKGLADRPEALLKLGRDTIFNLAVDVEELVARIKIFEGFHAEAGKILKINGSATLSEGEK